ncbi:ROK family protein [Alteribacillus sp. JSM 102045]|uniref:ROK family protein n=1 Tax=Alteribacillus sp. JSM 102045 TaxID=1562101 RepID=UPI0035C2558F
MKVRIGIDLGGTKLRIGAVRNDGILEEVKAIFTPSAPEEGVHHIIEGLRSFEKYEFKSIGCGAPGPLDSWKGILLDPPNLKGWHGFSFVKEIEQYTNLPVTLENDANAAAVAEYYLGVGKGASSIVYVTVSTGIGAGIVMEDHLISGFQGFAGEAGNMIIKSDTEQQGTLNNGSWEAAASGTAISSYVKNHFGKDMLPDHLFNEYKKGSAAAKKIVDQIIEDLAKGFANIYHLFNPELIVAGGGVINNNNWLISCLNEKIKGLLYPSMRESFKLVSASLGEKTGIVGAAMVSNIKRLG